MVFRFFFLKSSLVGLGRGVGIYFNKLIFMIYDFVSLGKELILNLEFGFLGIVIISIGFVLGFCGSKVFFLRRC